MSTRYGSATVTTPTDTSIVITRCFEAPLELVWEMVSMPRHVLRWWGPTWCPLVSCEMDLRPGGAWRHVAVAEGGAELVWRGTYQSIEPPARIVSTELFEGFPAAESVNTMTLRHVDGVTTLQTHVEHRSKEFRDGHLASGMEGGMQQTFDRLDDLLERADTTAERFRRVAGRFTDVVAEVPPEAWDNPAPCEGWAARDVVRHMVEWMPGMLESAGFAAEPAPSVDDDPLAAWTSVAGRIQALLDDPTIAASEVIFGQAGRHTVERGIGMIMLGDVVIHTWDLARATGVDDTLDPVIVGEMRSGMEGIVDHLVASGHYQPRVAVPDDAPEQTKLIALTGRDPEWSRT